MKLRLHNRFIYVGVDISIYALLTGDGVYIPLSRLVLYPRFSLYASVILVSLRLCSLVLPSARSCAVWDNNNKGDVCTRIYLHG